MARYAFTRTLPNISGFHVDFPVILTSGSFPSEAIDGGVNSLLNGGGNLRAYTDDTKATRLPLEIVKFVTGISPEIEVHVKIPLAHTGATIYLEADTVEISQPSFSDMHGRNSVWIDYDVVSHDGGSSDSVGNTFIDDGSGASVSSPWGDAVSSPRNRVSDISVGNRIDNFTLQCWHKGNGNGTLLSRRDGGNHQYAFGIFSGVYFFNTTTQTGNISLGSVNSGWQKTTLVINTATDIDFYVNGVFKGNINRTSMSHRDYPLRIGYRGNGGLGSVGYAYSGDQGEVRSRIGTISAEWEETENSMFQNPNSWGSSSQWINQDTGLEFSLDVDGGFFTSLFNPISTSFHRTVSLDSELFSFSGESVDLLVDRATVLSGDLFNAVTSDMGNLYNRGLELEGFTTTFDNSPVILSHIQLEGFTLDVSGEVFTYSEDSVSLFLDRGLTLVSGNFNLSNMNITLCCGRVLDTTGHSIICDNIDIPLSLVSDLEVRGEDFIYSGSTLGLNYSGSITILADGYSVSFEQDIITIEYLEDIIGIDYGRI